MSLGDWIRVAPLLSAFAIVGSASVALIVFVYTRRVNRRRATLEMIMRTFLEEDGRKRYDDFKAVIRKDQDLSDPFDLAMLVNWNAGYEGERRAVINQLNDYELVALGIRWGLFGERFYKRWFHRQFTVDFESVKKLIDELQKTRPTHFCEYRDLYLRWKKNKHPDTQPSRIKLAWWAVTGNFEKLDAARISMKL